jgi:hypothetical protein
MIRHARLALALAVLPLVITVVESSCRALLMPPVGGAPLTEARPLPAGGAAIALAAVAVGTEKEQGAAFGQKTKPLSQNHFAVRRHAGSQAVLDKRRDFVAG